MRHATGRTRLRAGTAAIVIATLLLATGCQVLFWETVRGSGAIETRELALGGDVTEVRVGSALGVEIVPGDEAMLTVRADDNVHGSLDIRERQRHVELRLHRGVRLRDATLEITVALPEATAVRASGASDVVLREGLGAEALEMSASGASELWGTVGARRLEVSASGASDVELDGAADEVVVSASGSSDVDLGGLSSGGDVRVDASGSSDVTVLVGGALTVRASGASEVRYSGDPTEVSSELSGASSLSDGG